MADDDELEIELEDADASADAEDGKPAARPESQAGGEEEPKADDPPKEEGSVADPDDDEDDDTDEYGHKVKKRIAKERRKRGDAERRAAALERELEEMRGRVNSIEQERAKETARQTDAAVNHWQAKLRQAKEDGDVDGEMQAQENLNAARQQQQAVKRKAEQHPSQPLPTAQNWVRQNADWFQQPDYQTETRAARLIDQELAQEGYDPNTPAYFTELDRRLVQQFPHLAFEDEGQKKAPAKKGERREPIGGGQRQMPGNGKRTVKLTAADQKLAREMGINLDDPAQRKAYAQEVAKSRAAG